jgi:hypothetical protein
MACQGVGDFTGDSKSDILWQNDSGQAAIWLLNGKQVLGGGLVSTILAQLGTSKPLVTSMATASRTSYGRMIPARQPSGC